MHTIKQLTRTHQSGLLGSLSFTYRILGVEQSLFTSTWLVPQWFVCYFFPAALSLCRPVSFRQNVLVKLPQSHTSHSCVQLRVLTPSCLPILSVCPTPCAPVHNQLKKHTASLSANQGCQGCAKQFVTDVSNQLISLILSPVQLQTTQ